MTEEFFGNSISPVAILDITSFFVEWKWLAPYSMCSPHALYLYYIYVKVNDPEFDIWGHDHGMEIESKMNREDMIKIMFLSQMIGFMEDGEIGSPLRRLYPDFAERMKKYKVKPDAPLGKKIRQYPFQIMNTFIKVILKRMRYSYCCILEVSK